MRAIKRHPVLSYFALAFGITWVSIYFITAPTGVPGQPGDTARLLLAVFLAMIAGPSIASLFLTGIVDGWAGYRQLIGRLAARRVGWQALTLLVPPVLLLAILGVLSLFSPVFLPAILTSADTGGLVTIALIGGLAAGLLRSWVGLASPRPGC